MNKKTVSYERLEKITLKLEKAIKTQDKELFNKWYDIAKKECDENRFSSFLIKQVKQKASEPNSPFFNFLVKEVKNEFQKENLREVILKIMGVNEVANYHALQEAWGNDFYNDDFFLAKTASSLISSYYIHGFSYDFDNILSFQPKSLINSYCKNLHMSNVENKDMANLLFNSLDISEKAISLVHNLEKSIENNKEQNIEYFYFKLVNDCEINQEIRTNLLITSLTPDIRKKQDNAYMSYKKKQEAQEYQMRLKGVVKNELTDNMLSPGGKFFKFLLDKVELKEKLESMQEKSTYVRKSKI